MRLSIAVLCVAPIVLLGASGARADENDRVEELEGEVADLRGRVSDLTQLVEDVLAEREAEGGVVAPGLHGAPGGGLQLPSLTIGGFSDVEYQVESVRPDAASNTTRNFFRLGDLDLFLSSQLSEKVSFLSEVLIEFEDQGGNIVDVERLLLKYEYADWLNGSAGRGHTPIGYWNTHYHHGSWLQTTVERPLLFEFEDEGGILPLHFVGLELSGRSSDTDFGLVDYAALVSNGRGRTTEAIQLGTDLNDSKMWTFRLGYRPGFLEGLEIGASVLGDEIPPNSDAMGRGGRIDELIAGGYLTYLLDPWELLVEGQMIRHRDRGLDETFYSSGGYAQLAYRYKKLQPYYRFDLLRIDPDDPFFRDLSIAQDTDQHTFGVRWDWASFAALKLEYRRRRSATFDSDLGVGQLSFAF